MSDYMLRENDDRGKKRPLSSASAARLREHDDRLELDLWEA